MSDVDELPVLFGPAAALCGVISRPSRGAAAPLACLLLNVGVTHHIGPRRLNVKLARWLAGLGVTSLRFDLSGIGDSGAALSRANFRDQSLSDLRAAMDEVTARTGIRRFVLLGICSGAINAYWAAQADERVVGLMMFDGFAYPTWKARVVHDWQRLRTTSPRVAVGKIVGRIGRLFGRAPVSAQTASIFAAAPDQTTPTRTQFAQALRVLDARGVALYLIYSGSVLVHYNHASQFRDAFAGEAFVQRVRCDFMADVDHLATPQSAQRRLLQAVGDWVTQLATPPRVQAAGHAPGVTRESAPA